MNKSAFLQRPVGPCTQKSLHQISEGDVNTVFAAKKSIKCIKINKGSVEREKPMEFTAFR